MIRESSDLAWLEGGGKIFLTCCARVQLMNLDWGGSQILLLYPHTHLIIRCFVDQTPPLVLECEELILLPIWCDLVSPKTTATLSIM